MCQSTPELEIAYRKALRRSVFRACLMPGAILVSILLFMTVFASAISGLKSKAAPWWYTGSQDEWHYFLERVPEPYDDISEFLIEHGEVRYFKNDKEVVWQTDADRTCYQWIGGKLLVRRGPNPRDKINYPLREDLLKKGYPLIRCLDDRDTGELVSGLLIEQAYEDLKKK